jgi:hypothetical protein
MSEEWGSADTGKGMGGAGLPLLRDSGADSAKVIEDCNVSLLQIANMPISGIESNLFILKELST